MRAAVRNGLPGLRGTFSDYLPTDDAAAIRVYPHDEVVWLRKVSNSSGSAR